MIGFRVRLSYFLYCLKRLLAGEGASCPSCGSPESRVVSRKYVVTALRRCNRCKILFRSPTTTPDKSENFYQSTYSQGFTTTLPSAEELERLKQAGFKKSEKDYSRHISMLSAIGCKPGEALLDYGCSWGYGSWQLARAGYRVCGYEISVTRCNFARSHLDIEAYTQPEDVQGPFDIFFSSHVLEHVPSVSESIRFARRVLRPGGWFVAYTPNGSEYFRRHEPWAWNQHWGLVHPNFLDEDFYQSIFRSDPHLVTSSPYDLEKIARWASTAEDSLTLDLAGSELVVIARLGHVA